MKTYCIASIMAVFLIFFANGNKAQTTQTKLNQVELMKQFLGNWNAEITKDTNRIMVYNPFHNAF